MEPGGLGPDFIGGVKVFPVQAGSCSNISCSERDGAGGPRRGSVLQRGEAGESQGGLDTLRQERHPHRPEQRHHQEPQDRGHP